VDNCRSNTRQNMAHIVRPGRARGAVACVAQGPSGAGLQILYRLQRYTLLKRISIPLHRHAVPGADTISSDATLWQNTPAFSCFLLNQQPAVWLHMCSRASFCPGASEGSHLPREQTAGRACAPPTSPPATRRSCAAPGPSHWHGPAAAAQHLHPTGASRCVRGRSPHRVSAGPGGCHSAGGGTCRALYVTHPACHV